MFEHRKAPLLSKKAYHRRLIRSVLIGLAIVVSVLTFGMIGYHYVENISWVDAYLESAMIFAGMGAIHPIQTTGGKIFAGSYALLSAFTLILPITIVLLPILHRFLHKFHLEEDS
jgi:hypothetical protein